MLMRVTFKDTDVLVDAILDRKIILVKELMELHEINYRSAENIVNEKFENMHKLASKVFKYGEYVTIELDDEAQTATSDILDNIQDLFK